jgi:hypothetical protein
LQLISGACARNRYQASPGTDPARPSFIVDAQATSDGRFSPVGYRIGDPIEFVVECRTRQEIQNPGLAIGIDNNLGVRVVTLHSRYPDSRSDTSISTGDFVFRCQPSHLFLVPGEYRVLLRLESRSGEQLEVVDPAFMLHIVDGDFNAIAGVRRPGVISCHQEWSIEPIR